VRRTIVFDLDGTLVESLPDIAASLNRVLAGAGLAPFTEAAVAGMVGDGAALLAARALAARGRGPDAGFLARFQEDYLGSIAVASRPYPGAAEALAQLAAAGWRMAVCTNKSEAAARKLLRALEILPHFAAVGGGDSFGVRKPDPRHLLATLAAAGGEPTRALMVGDHANDMAAARAAGVPPVFVLWGYGAAEMAGGATTARVISAVPGIAEALVPAEPERRRREPASGARDLR
jgi:phosphoglycolate phosphatase